MYILNGLDLLKRSKLNVDYIPPSHALYILDVNYNPLYHFVQIQLGMITTITIWDMLHLSLPQTDWLLLAYNENVPPDVNIAPGNGLVPSGANGEFYHLCDQVEIIGISENNASVTAYLAQYWVRSLVKRRILWMSYMYTKLP